MPPDIKGNPEAEFEVTQLPSGEVLNVRLLKSSGHTAYDAATERAIRKSSPLPKPGKSEPVRPHPETQIPSARRLKFARVIITSHENTLS